MRKKRIIISVILLLIVWFCIEFYVDNEMIETTELIVESTEIPESFDGYKILQMSDLHDKELGKDSKRLIEEIGTINPDIIVMTGDMITSNETEFTVFFELAKNLVDKYKVYYIEGNHEQDIAVNYEQEILNYLNDIGVEVLTNKQVTIEKSGEHLNLYGLQYDLDYYLLKNAEDFSEGIIEKALGNANENEFNILLSHNPRFFEEYASWGADLTFTGHIHGGMVRIPIFDIPIFSPDGILFPEYSKGTYLKGESKMIVSRGLGRGKRGFRFFNRPELVVAVLKSED